MLQAHNYGTVCEALLTEEYPHQPLFLESVG